MWITQVLLSLGNPRQDRPLSRNSHDKRREADPLHCLRNQSPSRGRRRLWMMKLSLRGQQPPASTSRKTKPRVDEAFLNRTGSVPPRPAASTSCVPCHCPECLPCREDCCENPAVRSGKCCDPRTLGQCLQPYEVRLNLTLFS